ncbi:hypothetical protein ACFSCW_12510 [Sphingomonas tabacisoli]|uniref:O-antigen ligase n=1 Tax=Sphingomonas tabacisoli TaxID=2249466 RepID=A0ABW4I4R2_9SPHN
MAGSALSERSAPVQVLDARAMNAEIALLLFAFALPFTRLVEVDLIGVLYIHDLLTFPLLIALLLRPHAIEMLRPMRLFLLLLGVWLVGAVLTDLVRHTAPNDYMRGWSRIALFGGNTVMLWLLSRGRIRVLMAYVLGAGLALAANTLINPTALMAEDPWKFGIGYGLAITCGVVATSRILQRMFTIHFGSVLIGAVGLASLFLNSRSLFAICLLASAYGFLASYVSRHPRFASKVNPLAFVGFILVGLVVGNFMILAYGELASTGVLGHAAQAKYYAQLGGTSGLNVIIGGRPEALVSLQAIADSPIIGHGSWARDPYYSLLYFSSLKEAGLQATDTYQQLGELSEFLIPSHSYVFGTWVEAGIAAVPIWIYVMLLAFRALYANVRLRTEANALISLVALVVMWDVLFSPFASDARISKAIEVCILIAANERLRRAGQAQSSSALASSGRAQPGSAGSARQLWKR